LNKDSWVERHIDIFDGSPAAFDSTHCMVLMVLSLGELALDDRLECVEKDASMYAQRAFSMLPAVILKNDITAIQCLITFWYTHNYWLT
jgi:hypothetical protein